MAAVDVEMERAVVGRTLAEQGRELDACLRESYAEWRRDEQLRRQQDAVQAQRAREKSRAETAELRRQFLESVAKKHEQETRNRHVALGSASRSSAYTLHRDNGSAADHGGRRSVAKRRQSPAMDVYPWNAATASNSYAAPTPKMARASPSDVYASESPPFVVASTQRFDVGQTDIQELLRLEHFPGNDLCDIERTFGRSEQQQLVVRPAGDDSLPMGASASIFQQTPGEQVASARLKQLAAHATPNMQPVYVGQQPVAAAQPRYELPPNFAMSAAATAPAELAAARQAPFVGTAPQQMWSQQQAVLAVARQQQHQTAPTYILQEQPYYQNGVQQTVPLYGHHQMPGGVNAADIAARLAPRTADNLAQFRAIAPRQQQHQPAFMYGRPPQPNAAYAAQPLPMYCWPR